MIYPAWLMVMAMSVSAIRSSTLISSTASTICVRRASPNCFWTSRSSVTITCFSFFSLARISLKLGDLHADFGQLLQDFVDGEPRQPVQLQFQDGVDLDVAQARHDRRKFRISCRPASRL